MAYDEQLAERVRAALDDHADAGERRMFGGIAFFVAGNMACGVMGDDLMVRVGPEQADALVGSEPGVRRMDMKGRPMRGWVLVPAAAAPDDTELNRWVARGVEFAAALPPK